MKREEIVAGSLALPPCRCVMRVLLFPHESIKPPRHLFLTTIVALYFTFPSPNLAAEPHSYRRRGITYISEISVRVILVSLHFGATYACTILRMVVQSADENSPRPALHHPASPPS